jgi:hypothetical protein
MHDLPSKSLSHERRIGPGSNRNFGLVMAGAFLIVAGLQLYSGSLVWALIWTVLAAVFAGLAAKAPGWLEHPNRLWFRFGLLLHRIINPLVLGLLFFVVVTPIGLVMRMFGQRPLALGFDKSAASYWISRSQPTPNSMRKQF